MDLLFKKGSTLKQKIATIIILILIVSVIWGGVSHIIVNESLFINNWSNYIAIALTPIALIFLFKSDSPYRKKLEEENKSIEWAALAIIITVPLMSKLTLERGIPIMLHTLTSKPSQMDVIVSKQISNKGCRKGVKLIGYERFANGKVCALHDKFLSFAQHGTKFTLIGEESPFGFTVDKYRYDEPTEQNKNAFISIISYPDVKKIDKDQYKLHMKNDKKTSIQVEYKQVVENQKNITLIKNPSETIQLATVKQDGNAIQYIKNPSEAVQLLAVKKDAYALQYIKKPSKKVQLTAVKKIAYVLQYIKNPSEEVQLAAVRKNGYALQYIKKQSEAVQLAGLKENFDALEYIKNPSEAVQLAIVGQDCNEIYYIKNPSEAVQLAAVKKNPKVLQYIKNPSKKVLDTAKRK